MNQETKKEGMWTRIPDLVKFSSVVIGACLGMMGYLTTYQSDAEAQTYQVQHGQQLANVRVDQIEQTIAAYRYKLLTENLTPQQREWIQKEIQRLEDKKKCIRDGTC